MQHRGRKRPANVSEIPASDEAPDRSCKMDTDAEITQFDGSESNEIPTAEESMSSDDDSSATGNHVTQAEVYDNLKRIGELEDEKKRIQGEIETRTEQLREVIGHIDRASILYKMLESALKDFSPKGGAASSGKKAAKSAPKVSAKAPKKKPRGK
jgi:uncharacterized protein (UPF0335 family)